MRRASPAAAAQPGDVGDLEATATAILTIDLSSLAANYRRLAALSAPAECAAVVKADAYGLGVAACAPALARAGCKTFFVATLAEAIELRALLPQAMIYLFDGLLPGTAPVFHAYDLRPVLNSADEIREWAAFCSGHRHLAPRRHSHRYRHEPARAVPRRGRSARRGGPCRRVRAHAGDEPSRLRR